MSNQEAKADAGKPKLTLVPRQIIFDIAEVREYGTAKYHDPDNWKRVEKERYRDAAFRHFLKYLDNPDGVDEESGISHLKHLACNIAFLCELETATVDTKQTLEHDGCEGCKYMDRAANVYPCSHCSHGYSDKYVRLEKPIDPAPDVKRIHKCPKCGGRAVTYFAEDHPDYIDCANSECDFSIRINEDERNSIQKTRDVVVDIWNLKLNDYWANDEKEDENDMG